MTNAEIAKQVTAKIIAQLEAGTAPWVKPWKADMRFSGQPFNAGSGRAYRGINVPLLFAPQYEQSAWLTFKQAKDLGANVRKGEKGSLIVFYKPFKVTDRNAQPDANGDRAERTIPLLRTFHVFNIAQIDNVPARLMPQPDTRTEPERHAEADKLLAQAQITHGGNRACYAPGPDRITLPKPQDFRDMADYYATALHELTHWTGHKSRLNRDFSGRFGNEQYAREELVAEMGAAFLCANVGIAGQLQHANYIASWLDVLRRDHNAILNAASHAQKAADYVTQAQAALPIEENAEAVNE